MSYSFIQKSLSAIFLLLMLVTASAAPAAASFDDETNGTRSDGCQTSNGNNPNCDSDGDGNHGHGDNDGCDPSNPGRKPGCGDGANPDGGSGGDELDSNPDNQTSDGNDTTTNPDGNDTTTDADGNGTTTGTSGGNGTGGADNTTTDAAGGSGTGSSQDLTDGPDDGAGGNPSDNSTGDAATGNGTTQDSGSDGSTGNHTGSEGNTTSPNNQTVDEPQATPEVANDHAQTLEDQAVTIDVAANDGGATGAVTIQAAPSRGTLTVDATLVTYKPNRDWSGTDSFTYTMEGASGEALVTIVVEDVNDPPRAAFDASTRVPQPGAPVALTSTSTDIDGNVVSVHWAFPDGTTSQGDHVSYAFAGTARQEVCITATDDDGASNTKCLPFWPQPPLYVGDAKGILVQGTDAHVSDTGFQMTRNGHGFKVTDRLARWSEQFAAVETAYAHVITEENVVRSHADLGQVTIHLPQGHVLRVEEAAAWSSASCGGVDGGVHTGQIWLDDTLIGPHEDDVRLQPITVPGATIHIDERIPNEDGTGITVNGIRVATENGSYIVGHTYAAVLDCPL